MNDDDQPATKGDLRDFKRELKQFFVEREIVALRWFIALQVTYFFGTLAMFYFLSIVNLHK